MKKPLEQINKHKGVVLYIVFGLLTTAVNYSVCLPLYHLLGFSAALSNAVAWLFAVIFSFFTNKPLVFKSNDWSFNNVLRELAAFFGCRILTGAIETAALSVLVDLLKWDIFFWKIVISAVVIVVNYICSKLLVFRNK